MPLPCPLQQSGRTGNYSLEGNRTKSPNYAGMTSRLSPGSAALLPLLPAAIRHRQQQFLPARAGHRENTQIFLCSVATGLLNPLSASLLPGFHGNFQFNLLSPLFPPIPEQLSPFPALPRLGFFWDGFYFLPTSPFVCLGLEFGIWSRGTDAWSRQMGWGTTRS